MQRIWTDPRFPDKMMAYLLKLKQASTTRSKQRAAATDTAKGSESVICAFHVVKATSKVPLK